MIEYFTFRRGVSVLSQLSILIIPVVTSFLSSLPPHFLNNSTQSELAIILLFVLPAAVVISYFLLQWAGRSTYSLRLHSWKFIVQSVVCRLGVAALLVLVGYYLLVYPYTGDIIPSLRDILAGLVLSSILLVGFSASTAVIVGSREKQKRKKQIVSGFLEECIQLKNATTGHTSEHSNRIISKGDEIIQNIESEPMNDNSALHSDLDSWISEFKRRGESDRQRMVGWLPSDSASRSSPWTDHYKKYQSVRQELSQFE